MSTVLSTEPRHLGDGALQTEKGGAPEETQLRFASARESRQETFVKRPDNPLSEYHVGRPNIGDRVRLQERIDDLLDRRWLTNGGKYVAEFEASVASIAGVKHCVAVCNGTIALELAIRALGLTGEVILPSFTFVATAHALQIQGITPVFCDIDPTTGTLDPACVEDLITPNTTGILGVHLWGRPCNVTALQEIASRHDLRLLYDAAHAFGCSADGTPVGGFGDAEVFSFHATKFVNAFEGGAVVTDSDSIAAAVRRMRNFGYDTQDEVVEVGTNGKMSEISAAMGLTSLESMDQFCAVNLENYRAYRARLSSLRGVKIIEYDQDERCNYQYVILEIDEEEAGVGRDLVLAALQKENVLARRYFHPGCHKMEPYATLFPADGKRLKQTELLAERVLALPTGTAVDREVVEMICHIITNTLNGGDRKA